MHDSQNLLDAETIEKRQFYYPHHRLRGVCEEVELSSLKPRKLYWNYLIAGVMRNRGAAGMMGCRLLGKV